jgi:hypothetical protein
VRVITAGATGPFNVAAEPVLTPAVIARLLGGRDLPIPACTVRAVLQASWHVRLQPLDRSWLDLLVNTPLLDTTRARAELGWRPQYRAGDTIAAVRRGVAYAVGTASPPLRAARRHQPRCSAPSIRSSRPLADPAAWLEEPEGEVKAAHAKARAVGERAVATLKGWRLLAKLATAPSGQVTYASRFPPSARRRAARMRLVDLTVSCR